MCNNFNVSESITQDVEVLILNFFRMDRKWRITMLRVEEAIRRVLEKKD